MNLSLRLKLLTLSQRALTVLADAQPTNGDHWITTEGGSRVLLDKNGNIKGGMGGKFTGQNIKDTGGTKKFTKYATNAEREQAKQPTPEAKPSPENESSNSLTMRDNPSKLSSTSQVEAANGDKAMKRIKTFRMSDSNSVRKDLSSSVGEIRDMGDRGIAVISKNKVDVENALNELSSKYVFDKDYPIQVKEDKKTNSFFFVIPKKGEEMTEVPQSHSVSASFPYDELAAKRFKDYGAVFDRESKKWYIDPQEAKKMMEKEGKIIGDDAYNALAKVISSENNA